MKFVYSFSEWCYYLIFTIFMCCDSVYARGKRKPTVMDKSIYDVIMKIESGNFKTAVKDRSKLERSANVHHWRYRGRWSVEIKDSEQILPLGRLSLIYNELIEYLITHRHSPICSTAFSNYLSLQVMFILGNTWLLIVFIRNETPLRFELDFGAGWRSLVDTELSSPFSFLKPEENE